MDEEPVELIPEVNKVQNLGARKVKKIAQIAREHCVHPSLPSWWRDELAENPEKAISWNGNKYKNQARIAKLERLLGQAHAENELLKGLRHDAREGRGGENKNAAEGRYMIIGGALSGGLQLSYLNPAKHST